MTGQYNSNVTCATYFLFNLGLYDTRPAVVHLKMQIKRGRAHSAATPGDKIFTVKQ